MKMPTKLGSLKAIRKRSQNQDHVRTKIVRTNNAVNFDGNNCNINPNNFN
jgi:hypothetical protein